MEVEQFRLATIGPELAHWARPSRVADSRWPAMAHATCYRVFMSNAAEKLFADALELPEDERAELACSLLESIEGHAGRVADRAQWADAWAAEVKARLAAMDAGSVGTPAHELIAALRRSG